VVTEAFGLLHSFVILTSLLSSFGLSSAALFSIAFRAPNKSVSDHEWQPISSDQTPSVSLPSCFFYGHFQRRKTLASNHSKQQARPSGD
jgi:hypothetical protein